MHIKRTVVTVVACAGLAAALAAADVNDWPSHDHDAGGQRFSPLKQISPANVATLRRAWTFDTGVTGLQVTPLVASGIMYVTAGKDIIALEPETAKVIWKYTGRLQSAAEASPIGPAIAIRRRACSAAPAIDCWPSTQSVGNRPPVSAKTGRSI